MLTDIVSCLPVPAPSSGRGSADPVPPRGWPFSVACTDSARGKVAPRVWDGRVLVGAPGVWGGRVKLSGSGGVDPV